MLLQRSWPINKYFPFMNTIAHLLCKAELCHMCRGLASSEKKMWPPTRTAFHFLIKIASSFECMRPEVFLGNILECLIQVKRLYFNISFSICFWHAGFSPRSRVSRFRRQCRRRHHNILVAEAPPLPPPIWSGRGRSFSKAPPSSSCRSCCRWSSCAWSWIWRLPDDNGRQRWNTWTNRDRPRQTGWLWGALGKYPVL